MVVPSEDLGSELSKLEDQLYSKIATVQNQLTKMVSCTEERNGVRRVILRRQVEKVLEFLNQRDEKATLDLKMKALESITEVNMNVSRLKKAVRNKSGSKEEMEEILKKMREEISILDSVARCTDLTVVENDWELFQMRKKGVDSLYLGAPDMLTPLDLEVGHEMKKGVEYIVIRALRSSVFNMFNIKIINVFWSTRNVGSGPTSGSCSLKNLVDTRRAIRWDAKTFLINPLELKLSLRYEITVSVFGVSTDACVYSSFQSSLQSGGGHLAKLVKKDLASHAAALPADHDLDSSDIASLDMTSRKELLTGGQNGPPSAPARKVSKPTNLSEVEEVSAESGAGGQQSLEMSTTVFSPMSDRCAYSTLRPTSAAAKLAGALSALNGKDLYQPPSESSPPASSLQHRELEAGLNGVNRSVQNGHPTAAATGSQEELVSDGRKSADARVEEEGGGDVSLIVPSTSIDRLSVEDMQKSLSREGTPNTSVEMQVDKCTPEVVEVNLADRSISFATKTQIFEDLPTPQVKIQNSRYSVVEGNTKEKDGVTGMARKLLQLQKFAESMVSGAHNDGQTSHTENSSSSSSSSSRRHNNTEESPSQDNSDWDETVDDVYKISDATLEYFRNASLLTDSCWDEEEEEKDKDKDKGDEWQQVSKAQVLNQGGSPDVADHPSGTDCAGSGLDFVAETWKVAAEYTGPKGRIILRAPEFLSVMKDCEAVAVSEPSMDRIGVYSQEEFTFQGWLGSSKLIFRQPSNILSLSNGTIVVLDINKLTIFNRSGKVEETLEGSYTGLTEGAQGEIITLEKMGPFFWLVELLDMKDGLRRVRKTEWTALRKCVDWETNSRPTCLLRSGNTVYITDTGMGKIFSIHLITGNESCFYSSDLCDPAGLVQDDKGNFALVDRGGPNLLVLSPEGKLVKEISLPSTVKHPVGIVRQGNSLLVAVRGDSKKKRGKIVRLRPQNSGC